MPPVTPNLFIVGAPRCGTTALYTYLRAHPQVFMCTPKEPHFFSPDVYLPAPHHPVRDATEYRLLFRDAAGERYFGEASVFYLYSETAPRRIREWSPDARVIIMLRNPPDMMYSMYQLRSWAAAFHPCQERLLTFEAALAAEPARRRGERLPAGVPAEPGRGFYLCYRALGEYANHVARYLATFHRDQIHVVVFDDWCRDVAGSWAQVCRFLGIDPDLVADLNISVERRAAGARVRSNRLARILADRPAWVRRLTGLVTPPGLRTTTGRLLRRLNSRRIPRLDPVTRGQLLRECAYDIRRTGELIGHDLTHWLEATPRQHQPPAVPPFAT